MNTKKYVNRKLQILCDFVIVSMEQKITPSHAPEERDYGFLSYHTQKIESQPPINRFRGSIDTTMTMLLRR